MAAPQAGDTINYVFGFGNAGEAAQDPTVGRLTAQEVLLYFYLTSSVVPYAGYQPMVSQPAPINEALYNHPALLFALDLAQPARGQSAILKSVFSALEMAHMMMVLSNYGTIIVGGLT